SARAAGARDAGGVLPVGARQRGRHLFGPPEGDAWPPPGRGYLWLAAVPGNDACGGSPEPRRAVPGRRAQPQRAQRAPPLQRWRLPPAARERRVHLGACAGPVHLRREWALATLYF